MKKYIFTESQVKKIINHQIIQESSHHDWWDKQDGHKKEKLTKKHFPDKTTDTGSMSNNEIKRMYDNEHDTGKKEFRPGVDLGKYNLKKIFIGDKDDEGDKKPFSSNRLKSKK